MDKEAIVPALCESHRTGHLITFGPVRSGRCCFLTFRAFGSHSLGALLGYASSVLLLSGSLLTAQAVDQFQSVTLLDAVQSALQRHTEVAIKREQVHVSEALHEQSSAIFDDLLNAGVSHNRYYVPYTALEGLLVAEQFYPLVPIPSGSYQDFSTLQVSDTRLLPDGITISPIYSQTHFVANDSPPDIAGINTTHADMQIVFPLLAGRGRMVTTAQERATGMEVNATQLDLRQTLADLIFGACTNYWNLVAAQASLVVAKDSEKRGLNLVEDVRALIDGDREPRSNLNNVLANLEERRATRVQAEQHVVDVRQALAVAMGLGENGRPRTLNAIEEFPLIPAPGSIHDDAETIQRYIEVALSRRADYQAGVKRVNESRVLREAAERNLLPHLDLTVQAGYSGIAQGRQLGAFLSSPATNVQGLDLIASLNYRFPLGNHAAKGALAQTQAQLQQTDLQRAEIGRDIAVAVVHDLRSIQNALAAYQRARAGVDYYRSGLQAEEEKLALGVGSVVDILTVEDRLTTSLQSVVQAQLNYFLAIAQFRYTTGAFIPLTGPEAVMSGETLTTFPVDLSAEHGQ